MNDFAADRAIKDDAEELVRRIAKRWPESRMTAVHDDMRYGQYAEAVLDLVAISHRDKMKLKMSEVESVMSLIDRMEIKDDVRRLIRRLKERDPQPVVDESEPVAAFLLR